MNSFECFFVLSPSEFSCGFVMNTKMTLPVLASHLVTLIDGLRSHGGVASS